MPTGDTVRLAEGNLAFLRQALDLVRRLSDDDYRGVVEDERRGGVGAHFRHILDHYECFVRGLLVGRIDYDVRERDRALETERARAIQRLEALLHELPRIGAHEARRSLHVGLDCGEGGARIWSTSTVARELQFLVSHTVHHFAVIAVMLRQRGVEPGRDFGVAPSTLKYEQSGAVCAR